MLDKDQDISLSFTLNNCFPSHSYTWTWTTVIGGLFDITEYTSNEGRTVFIPGCVMDPGTFQFKYEISFDEDPTIKNTFIFDLVVNDVDSFGEASA
mmetsp:Transcript_23671/g.20579  ORF Transcript_23671/g.20579 Transcript_23671/m.20579 type:complete len:96 (+) Transcript_23671:334-621(+)